MDHAHGGAFRAAAVLPDLENTGSWVHRGSTVPLLATRKWTMSAAARGAG
jgi:hypothetical protein